MPSGDAVYQRLLDRGLGEWLRDDTDIRASEQWDDRIGGMMDAAAVAVLIVSEHYFRRRRDGGEYILERELPYLIEHYKTGERP